MDDSTTTHAPQAVATMTTEVADTGTRTRCSSGGATGWRSGCSCRRSSW